MTPIDGVEMVGGFAVSRNLINRREFLAGATLAAGTLLAGKTLADLPASGSVRFGVIADLHHGYVPDALKRLQAFLVEMNRVKPDFIIELGDFCNRPANAPSSAEVHRCWDTFAGPRYHVLGNHDLDFQSKQAVLAAWGMKSAYYSFDNGTFHFVVLDCNYISKKGRIVPWERGNAYGNLLPPEQLQWLRQDLAKTNKQTVIFSHQGLDDLGVINRKDVRRALAEANKEAGFDKVIACLCGHYHLDGLNTIEGIHYLQINSASYSYVGGTYGDDGSGRATYRDPLFALVTLDPAGRLTVAGRKSEFRHPTPREKNYPKADRITANLSEREATFGTKRLHGLPGDADVK